MPSPTSADTPAPLRKSARVPPPIASMPGALAPRPIIPLNDSSVWTIRCPINSSSLPNGALRADAYTATTPLRASLRLASRSRLVLPTLLGPVSSAPIMDPPSDRSPTSLCISARRPTMRLPVTGVR